MLTPMRRVPVERARHAKRLGPIILTTSPQGATSTTAATPTSTTSSSAPPTSSSSPSSPSSSVVSPTTPSTHSSPPTSSDSAHSSSTTPPPSSSITPQPVALTSTYPTSSSTPAPTPQSHASPPSSGLSGGAIAGIIAGAVIVGVALIVFFVRKTYLRRRERRRIEWDEVPGSGILDEPKFPDISDQSDGGVPLSPFECRSQSTYIAPVAPAVRMQRPNTPTYTFPSPPPATYNNPHSAPSFPASPAVSTYSHGNMPAYATGRTAAGMQPSARVYHPPMEATVKFTFVPTLPDELSISTGERVFIVEQYDDGWDLCTNGRCERGMVPRECLSCAPSDQPDMGWMNTKRMSSLNPDGNRY